MKKLITKRIPSRVNFFNKGLEDTLPEYRQIFKETCPDCIHFNVCVFLHQEHGPVHCSHATITGENGLKTFYVSKKELNL